MRTKRPRRPEQDGRINISRKVQAVTEEKEELARIRKELATISIALSVIAMDQAGAGDAGERKRHEQASTKALNLLLERIEEL
jgi:hypothetical protein